MLFLQNKHAKLSNYKFDAILIQVAGLIAGIFHEWLAEVWLALPGGADVRPKMKIAQGPINSKALVAYVQKDKAYEKALDLSRKLFKGDKRDYTGVQYISHAMTVGSLLLEIQAQASTMLASALQDLLARERVKPKTIEELFGAEALTNVKALTPVKLVNGDLDIKAYGEQLKAGGNAIQTIKTASLLDHVCSIPKKNLAGAFKLLEQVDGLLPYLEGGNAELLRRLSVALRNARA